MSAQIRVMKDAQVRTPRLMRFFNSKSQVAQSTSNTPSFNKSSLVSRYSFFAVIIAALLLVSCQKEQLNTPVINSTTSGALQADAASKKPSDVDAGPVRRVVYDASVSSTSAVLYGRVLGNKAAVTVRWTQTGGNSTATIAQPDNDTTNVSNLKPGLYTFVLTATDANGVSSSDSTFVTVLQKMTWTIEGVTREALVHIPTGGVGAAPVMFAFHGHGGTDLGFAERAFEVSWPEAIVVYPQGLPTISNSDKTGRGNGWQHSVGEVNNHTGVKDQDLKFFDAMLATLDNTYHGDSHLVFAHGWSNGGEFVYDALWAARGEKLTALAPAAATLGTTSGKRSMPVIHVAGTSDPHVHFSNQQKSVQGDRTVNSCSETGTTWAKGAGGLLGTQYASATNNQVVLLQYNGGHAYPFTVPPYIVQFFKDAAGL